MRHGSPSLGITSPENGKTYYWTVIPQIGEDVGICLSGIWSFSVELNKKPSFDLNLTLSLNIIELKPGDNKEIKASVKNLATIRDEIELKLDFISIPGFNSYIIEPKKIELEPDESYDFSIVISISKDINLKEILLTITAKSNDAPNYGQSVEKSEILTVKILETLRPDDGNKDKKSDYFNLIIEIVIVIVILLMVILIIFIFMRKKKKEPEEIKREPKLSS